MPYDTTPKSTDPTQVLIPAQLFLQAWVAELAQALADGLDHGEFLDLVARHVEQMARSRQEQTLCVLDWPDEETSH